MLEAQKLYSKNIYDEYSPPNTLSVIKSRNIICMSAHLICDINETHKM